MIAKTSATQWIGFVWAPASVALAIPAALFCAAALVLALQALPIAGELRGRSAV